MMNVLVKKRILLILVSYDPCSTLWMLSVTIVMCSILKGIITG